MTCGFSHPIKTDVHVQPWGLVSYRSVRSLFKTESEIIFPSTISPPPFHAKVYLPANCCCPSGPAGLLTSPLLRHPSGMLATMSALMLPTTATVATMGGTPAPHMPLLALPPKPSLDGKLSFVANKSGTLHAVPCIHSNHNLLDLHCCRC